MAQIIANTQVKDFDSWKPGFEAAEPLRNSGGGISNPRIFRSVTDGNDIVIIFDVEDVDRARAFLTSDRIKEAMKNIGVVNGPRITAFS